MQDRIRRLCKIAGSDVVITAPVDLEYLTGLPLSAGVVVARDESVLLVDGRYIEIATHSSTIPAVLGGLGDLEQYLGKTVAFDASTMSVSQLKEMQAKAPGITFKGIPRLLQHVRAVKDEKELAILRAAAKLSGQGFDFLKERLVEGITEKQLARDLEIFWLEQGGEGLSFSPIIAFGPHSAFPHHHPTDRTLKRGEPVLLDFGVCLGRYQSDMTRVVFFGNVSDEIRKIYRIVQDAVEVVQASCRSGVTGGMLDRKARDLINAAGYGKYFSHSLGHGVGLEVHELPILRQGPPFGDVRLEANMVITVEPGIYLPDLGGVRLENTVVVHEDECEVLTPCSFLE